MMNSKMMKYWEITFHQSENMTKYDQNYFKKQCVTQNIKVEYRYCNYKNNAYIGAQSDSDNDRFSFSDDASSPERSWFQTSAKSFKPFGCMKRLCILQLPIIPYCGSLTL